jgi:hypothetical protein
MPLVFGLAGLLFQAYSWILTTFGLRVALGLFFAGTVVTCGGVVLVLVKAAVSLFSSAAIAGAAGAGGWALKWLLMVLWAIVPDNFPTFVATIIALDVAQLACRWHLAVIAMIARSV